MRLGDLWSLGSLLPVAFLAKQQIQTHLVFVI
jgi:hypothetical protein